MKLLLMLLIALLPSSLFAQNQVQKSHMQKQDGHENREINNQIRSSERKVISYLKRFGKGVALNPASRQSEYYELQTKAAVEKIFILERMAPQKGKPDEATGFPAAYRALANIELKRLKYEPDDFDLEKAKFNAKCYLALKPDSAEARLLYAKVLEQSQDSDARLEQLKVAFELDVHEFQPYFDALTDQEDKNRLLDQVGSKIEEIVQSDTFDINKLDVFSKTIDDIVNVRFELTGDVSKEVRVFNSLKSNSAIAGFYQKNRVSDLESNLSVKRAHYHFSRGEIKEQLELLKRTFVKDGAVHKNDKPRITPRTRAELVQVMLDHPEWAMQAREIFDPLDRNVSSMEAAIAKLIADHLSKKGEVPELVEKLRERVYAGKQFQDAIKWMEALLDSESNEIISALRSIDSDSRNIWRRARQTTEKHDKEKPWLDFEAVDSLPIRRRSPGQDMAEVNKESAERYFFLRGRLAMKIGHFGTAAHYLRKASELNGVLDVQPYLEESTAKLLADDWEGPRELFPTSNLPRLDQSVAKKQLLKILNLDSEVASNTTTSRKQKSPVEIALEIVNSSEVNWQTKRHRDAIKTLEEVAAKEKTVDADVCLALVHNEMNRYGSRNDKNFDADYVFGYLAKCKTKTRPLPMEVYRAYSNIYRRLGRANEYLENTRAMVGDHPSAISSLYAANIAVKRQDDNTALLRQECDRLKKLVDEKPESAAEASFVNRLNWLATKTDDPDSVSDIYQSIAENCNSILPRRLADGHRRLKLRKPKDETNFGPWSKMALAVVEKDKRMMHSAIRTVAKVRSTELSVENQIKLIKSAIELELVDLKSRDFKSLLESILRNNERKYTSIFWVTRSDEKIWLKKLLAKSLMKSGDHRALLHLEAILETQPDDEETKKLLEECKEMPSRRRRGRPSKPL